MAIIRSCIFQTILLKIPAVMSLVSIPSIYQPQDHVQFTYADGQYNIQRPITRWNSSKYTPQYPTSNHTTPIQHDTHGQFPDNNNRWMEVFPQGSLEMKPVFLVTTHIMTPRKTNTPMQKKTAILQQKWLVFPILKNLGEIFPWGKKSPMLFRKGKALSPEAPPKSLRWISEMSGDSSNLRGGEVVPTKNESND